MHCDDCDLSHPSPPWNALADRMHVEARLASVFVLLR
jgi:hypothetical protein